jgi:hypothetical protein
LKLCTTYAIAHFFLFCNHSESDVESDIARSNLDSLIEAGDWAAVGATAALLAAASDSASQTDKSLSTAASQRTGKSASTVDAARVAELDNLVDAGDWEGVVLAAAKFEAAENSGADTDFASVDTSALSEKGGSSAPSTSVSSRSETGSTKRKRDQVRKEVEELVMRVVPEEIENVDEMMIQFKGREEELVETLRTMEERLVAQKARKEGQKAAKIQARQTAKLSASSASADTSVRSKSSAERRTSLEAAIESGDWEAVGNAAALMEEESVEGTASPDSNSVLDAASEASSKRSGLSGIDADRAEEIDAMIRRGDWAGVMEATKNFSKQGEGQSSEEKEALAEAEAWTKIAEQKKAKGASDAGASDAAEWAIERSLSQLKQADAKQTNMKKLDDDENEV